MDAVACFRCGFVCAPQVAVIGIGRRRHVLARTRAWERVYSQGGTFDNH